MRIRKQRFWDLEQTIGASVEARRIAYGQPERPQNQGGHAPQSRHSRRKRQGRRFRSLAKCGKVRT